VHTPVGTNAAPTPLRTISICATRLFTIAATFNSILQSVHKSFNKYSRLSNDRSGDRFLGRILKYHKIIFSQKSNELDLWITQATPLKVDEIDTYVNGLLADIEAVKNAIQYKYNNGLAESSVNKIKLTK